MTYLLPSLAVLVVVCAGWLIAETRRLWRDGKAQLAALCTQHRRERLEEIRWRREVVRAIRYTYPNYDKAAPMPGAEVNAILAGRGVVEEER